MKRVDERKRRLISQISHLKKEVDKLIQSRSGKEYILKPRVN